MELRFQDPAFHNMELTLKLIDVARCTGSLGSSRRDAKMRLCGVPHVRAGRLFRPQHLGGVRFAQSGLPLAMKLAAPPQQLPASNSRQGKEREVLLHKILRVAPSVAQKAAKAAQTPFLCSTASRKLLICIRWEYYLANFDTVGIKLG
jgi:hypothetical protein